MRRRSDRITRRALQRRFDLVLGLRLGEELGEIVTNLRTAYVVACCGVLTIIAAAASIWGAVLGRGL